jgi:hypothetical protein
MFLDNRSIMNMNENEIEKENNKKLVDKQWEGELNLLRELYSKYGIDSKYLDVLERLNNNRAVAVENSIETETERNFPMIKLLLMIEDYSGRTQMADCLFGNIKLARAKEVLLQIRETLYPITEGSSEVDIKKTLETLMFIDDKIDKI